MVVVLPAPLGPKKPNICPALTSKLMLSIAVKVPYLFTKFSIIIANSIVQYYRSQVEIIDLVKSVKKIAMKDAQFLISDIVVTRDKIKKYPKLIYNSISNGYFVPLMKMSLRLIVDKKYSNIKKYQPILIVNIDKLIEDLSVIVKNITIVNEILTVNTDRKHLLVQF